MAERGANHVYLLKAGVLALAVAAYYLIPGLKEFVWTGLGYLDQRDFEGLRRFILAHGVWAPLTTIALMTAQSLVPLVPGLVITLCNAWIFGWEYGALYSWIGALLGAGLDFGVARWYGRPVVERFVRPKYLDLADKFFRRYGVLAVFISRLTPLIPFKVISYSAGLTVIAPRQFVLATGIGQAPPILLYSILGQQLMRGVQAIVAVTSLLLIVSLVVYRYRSELEKRLFSPKDSD